MACTAASLLATAMAAGYAKLSDRSLRECIVVSACAASGGGGGGGVVSSGAGAPVADPGVANALYTDTNTGILYSWYSGAWH